MKKYNPPQIEKKWQKYWEEHQTFKTPEKPKSQDTKQYVLDMIPYVSAAGLHVGHPEGYTATDILSRYLRMKGFDVFHPMGWDAFGLPTENYAIKTGVHPGITTQKSIARFREQIKAIGLSYDWEREVSTADPGYYKWTQWLFLLFYKHGLAYKKEASVNWCPKDNTVLANEQVVAGACERCGTKVVQKLLSQWFFKITDYTERLLQGLDGLDWPEPIKAMQRNWIGKKQGINITYQIEGRDDTVTCFTTRPDTNFGATFIVIGPEHPLLAETNPLNLDTKHWSTVKHYKEKVSGRTEMERMAEVKKKTGVFTGLYCINNLNSYRMPLYVADYVLGNVGTGAVVGVPGHDKRDFEFAQIFGIPVVRVVQLDDSDNDPITSIEQVQEDEGIMVNSDFLNGLDIHKATQVVMDRIEKEGWGRRVVTYKLRDWLVSRQRYWGAPIPIIYCDKCGPQAVPEKDLPVMLPTDVDFLPTGESPLARSKSFHDVTCPNCDGPAQRDSDTMDTFVDSSWYFYRYTDPQNDKEFADKRKIDTWLPVDTYVGGAEHAVLHLLYSRFFAKVLFDLKFVKFEEPFLKLRNQGLILGPDGEKMSKSRGNVINPDDIIAEFGADSLRMYEMFMGPLEDAKPWNTNGLVGLRRFLERVWVWVHENKANENFEDSPTVKNALDGLIAKITDDITSFRFNTAISSFMQFHNGAKREKASTATLRTFLVLLYPFAPHIAEELHELLGGKESLQKVSWPDYPKIRTKADQDVVVQINGKKKDVLTLPTDSTAQQIEAAVLASEKVVQALAGQQPKRIVVAPNNRLVNIVA